MASTITDKNGVVWGKDLCNRLKDPKVRIADDKKWAELIKEKSKGD